MPGTSESTEQHLESLAERARYDDEAFGTLVGSVRTLIVRWTRSATRDHDDAEDVAQLVLLRLRQNLGHYSGRSRFTTWLYRMTHNIVLDRHRVERRRKLLLAAATLDQRYSTDVDSDTADAAPTETSDVRLEPLVRAFLTELTPRQQAVFEAIDLRGESTTHVATRLGIAPSTVRVLLMQARRAIRLHLIAKHSDLLRDYSL
jgi:RNA polymerase sigma-70 factor, ECF subfamily